uniref:CCR4-NOT transcription complex subunit 4 n=1 Tax=Anoplophora glabripennis TaxID=217634 RepID=V5GR05_ANOGL
MSVLNQSGEEQVECPLCMEPLEVDDLNFFPCTCGYQICRFCWHRIRTDENGLCPACRKAYSENPADFIPLSQEQVAKLKAEKRQRDQQRKAKLTESRKHLASVRVVQRNLVFVVGLPMRLADPEVLKRHEYFGKFGKIHKVVINQSTSYAGSQGPSASAYVTYMKSDDALRAIQSVNNITIDGRLIKSSLGTTKYCSHFMKNQTCPKPDCMYLHDFGDSEASFTKEQMHAGKHQEYEKKLHENLLSRTANNNNNTTGVTADSSKASAPIPTTGGSKSSSKENVTVLSSSVSSSSSTTSNVSTGTNKDGWPQLEKEKREKEKGRKGKAKGESSIRKERKEGAGGGKGESRTEKSKTDVKEDKPMSPAPTQTEKAPTPPTEPHPPSTSSKLPPIIDDNSSFFSLNSFQKIAAPSHPDEQADVEHTDPESTQPSAILTDTLPNINTTEDWAAAFGFPRHASERLVEEIGTKQQEEMKGPLDTFRNGFSSLGGHDNGFSKDPELYNGLYEMSKMHENIMDALSNKSSSFGYKQEPQPPVPSISNGLNALDQNMSKFFMDFHKNNKEVTQPQYSNGFNGIHQNYYPGVQGAADRIMLLQQKQLEEQLLNLSLKQGFGGGSGYQNGMTPQRFLNGDNGGFGNIHEQLYNSSNVKQSSRNVEDELGFDPFQETQKAFAELMASEQNHKTHSTGRSQVNGVIHNQNGGQLPPPPGFVQQNTHMNSFDISNSCNDWKVLDPAILSSSRHYPLANMPPIRDHYSNVTQLGTQQQLQNGAPLRSYEYTNNAFSNFTQQLQPNFNNFSHLSSPQNLNWFSSDLNSQISSPPGFRNSQTTKQQEC